MLLISVSPRYFWFSRPFWPQQWDLVFTTAGMGLPRLSGAVCRLQTVKGEVGGSVVTEPRSRWDLWGLVLRNTKAEVAIWHMPDAVSHSLSISQCSEVTRKTNSWFLKPLGGSLKTIWRSGLGPTITQQQWHICRDQWPRTRPAKPERML